MAALHCVYPWPWQRAPVAAGDMEVACPNRTACSGHSASARVLGFTCGVKPQTLHSSDAIRQSDGPGCQRSPGTGVGRTLREHPSVPPPLAGAAAPLNLPGHFYGELNIPAFCRTPCTASVGVSKETRQSLDKPKLHIYPRDPLKVMLHVAGWGHGLSQVYYLGGFPSPSKSDSHSLQWGFDPHGFPTFLAQTADLLDLVNSHPSGIPPAAAWFKYKMTINVTV